MDEVNGQNGNGNGQVYVKFGHGTTDEMPREWAEKMLIAWRESNPSGFGKALAKVVTEGLLRRTS